MNFTTSFRWPSVNWEGEINLDRLYLITRYFIPVRIRKIIILRTGKLTRGRRIMTTTKGFLVRKDGPLSLKKVQQTHNMTSLRHIMKNLVLTKRISILKSSIWLETQKTDVLKLLVSLSYRNILRIIGVWLVSLVS